jgi:hypothetical protein
MQRERSKQIGGHHETRSTRYEIAECDDCGHEYVRPIARPNLLPCKCGAKTWAVSPLIAGQARPMAASC